MLYIIIINNPFSSVVTDADEQMMIRKWHKFSVAEQRRYLAENLYNSPFSSGGNSTSGNNENSNNKDSTNNTTNNNHTSSSTISTTRSSSESSNKNTSYKNHPLKKKKLKNKFLKARKLKKNLGNAQLYYSGFLNPPAVLKQRPKV